MPRKLGQHFLRSDRYLERIRDAACPVQTPLVIEIGAGEGALTAHLIERASRVIAIEIDATLVSRLMVRFAGDRRVKVVAGDVLATDLTQWGPAVVAGNLPYYITSPVIERVLALGRLLRYAVFLIQKEVADRLVAEPGTRDYGFLTVATQLSAKTDLLFKVPPGAFSPPPKVESAVVRLTPLDATHDPTPLLAFAGLCFRHKRKTLRNNLEPFFGKEAVAALPEAGLRAEQLTLDQFRSLYARVAGR
ncbi:MAG: 16S rRNA (adenine(1518)-N(6)/adenine(1519)-N(6))-dimethyltransferase RsmA [Bryobacteraceae bacterium]